MNTTELRAAVFKANGIALEACRQRVIHTVVGDESGTAVKRKPAPGDDQGGHPALANAVLFQGFDHLGDRSGFWLDGR